MKRALLILLMQGLHGSGFSQTREIQGSLSVFPANFKNFLVESRFKYRFAHAPFVINTGIEYLNSSGDFLFPLEHFTSRRLISPVVLNVRFGKKFMVYGGGGIFLGVNFYKGIPKGVKPTRVQFGDYFNGGFQLKVKQNIFINLEGKWIIDLTPTYRDLTGSPSGYSYYEVKSASFWNINLGVSYRLRDQKK